MSKQHIGLAKTDLWSVEQWPYETQYDKNIKSDPLTNELDCLR